MNTHLNDGQLRAALDDELGRAELQHLEQCPACQLRANTLRAQVRTTSRRLSFLLPSAHEKVPAPGAALNTFYERKLPKKELTMFKRMFASTTFRFAAIGLLLLVLVVSIPSTRALADQLLSLFRVQQVTVIPVDFTGMQQLTGNSALGKQISTLISDSTTVTEKAGDPVTATDAADASQKTGFTVRLPSSASPSRISVMNASSFTFTIDRTKAQALLDEAGRKDLQLPAAIDGAVIDARIPASVSSAFGNCPQPSADGKSSDSRGSMGRQYPDCVIFSQLPSPTVSAPAGVDVAQLAQIGLEFSGMTTDQAAAFTKTVDWSSTLVIPIPRNAATYQQVSVDGVTGTLIQRPADDAPEYLLVWVKNGVVYAIGGLGADTTKALAMANSLP
jgi:hypothetical protein